MTGIHPHNITPRLADHDGVTSAAVAAIGVAIALAEATHRPEKAHEYDFDAEVAAVIASALALAEADDILATRTAQVRQASAQQTKAVAKPSPWAHAGRMRQMDARLQPLIRGRRSR